MTVGSSQYFLPCCCGLVFGAVLKSTFMNVSLLHIKSNFMFIQQAPSPDKNGCMAYLYLCCKTDKLILTQMQWEVSDCDFHMWILNSELTTLWIFCPPLSRQIYARLWLRSNASPNSGRKLADIFDILLSPCWSGLTMPHRDRGCKLILASQRGRIAGDKWLHCWCWWG